MNAEQLEKYSSAMTLSDMEVFIFPELMYSLVLANIMSPVIWQWRQIDCFKKLEGKSPYRKLMRLKQFIIDEYEFIVQPRLAGHGPTLFAGLSKHVDLKLVSRLEFKSGAVALRYEPRG